jgi:ribokinase
MKKSKIAVIGSFVVDLTSRAGRLPVAGETVKGTVFKLGPGGKGSNQAVAAHRAGADMILATKVGNDVFGRVALDFYENENMDTSYVFIDQEKETGTALIMVDEVSGQNQILVVSGACDHITDEEIDKLKKVIEESEFILLQLEINMDAIEKVIEIAHQMGKTVVLNTAPAHELSDELLSKVDIITPNETEAEVLTGVKIQSEADAEKAAVVLMQRGVKNVVITLGKSGVFVMTADKKKMIAPLKVKVVDTTGAGDAFNGGFVTALAEGMDIFEAAWFGNVVGSLSVTKLGTAPAMPYRDEIDKNL